MGLGVRPLCGGCFTNRKRDSPMTPKRPRDPNQLAKSMIDCGRLVGDLANALNQANNFGVIFQTDPLPPACMRTKRELCSLYVLKQGGGDVEGFCGGSGCVGVDRAVCRDDRDMGPSDPQSVIPNL